MSITVILMIHPTHSILCPCSEGPGWPYVRPHKDPSSMQRSGQPTSILLDPSTTKLSYQCCLDPTPCAICSGSVKSKWNMGTITQRLILELAGCFRDGPWAAGWCYSCTAFCLTPSDYVTASVDLVQFSFQLPVVYYHHSHWYCGINHPDWTLWLLQTGTLLGDVEPWSCLALVPLLNMV